jgi:hypothetical protein
MGWRADQNMAKHPNKHFREAIRYAESKGWRVNKGRTASPYLGYALLPRE